MSLWAGGHPLPRVMQEWKYSARLECRLEPSGSISVVQIGGKHQQDITAEMSSRMSTPASLFAGYNKREMGIWALLLDREWAQERLVSAGLLDGLDGHEEELRKFGKTTGRLLTAFKQASGEKRVEYQR